MAGEARQNTPNSLFKCVTPKIIHLAIGVITMYFLQQATPETTQYMIAGFAVIFGVLALYLLSLVIRSRNLNRDAEILQELESGENASTSQNLIG